MTDQPGLIHVTIRRANGPIRRWQADIEHCPPSDPAVDFPRGCVAYPMVYAFTRARLERKVRHQIAWWAASAAAWRDAEVLTIPWPERET